MQVRPIWGAILLSVGAVVGVACYQGGAPAPRPAPAAQTAKSPVVWSGPAAPVSAAAGSKASVNIAATIASGWHIYALTQAGAGPAPLEITMPASQPFKIAGAIVSTKPETKFDEGFGMNVNLLVGRAEFALPVTVSKIAPGKQSMIVEARYQACNSNLCLPARTDRIEVPVVIK
jgi:hypothetical protein